MIDTHNDLLTLAYCCYLKNDYQPLIEFNKMIKEGNAIGIIANLYFMSIEEMKDELDDNYYNDDISIVDMFKISKKILNNYIPDVHFIYCIEGCDYLDISDLKALRDEGLNSIILVWNNPSKYGSGNRDIYGLTNLGKSFIIEAMNLGLGIDISHANKKTCMDILNLVKEKKYPLVYGSHSNIKRLYDHSRNLDDEEIELLKEVNGKLGLVTVNLFVTDEFEYIEHIKYAVDKLGIDNVMIASDNMDYTCIELKDTKLFDYQDMNRKIRLLLGKIYNKEEIDKIMFRNALKLFNELEEN